MIGFASDNGGLVGMLALGKGDLASRRPSGILSSMRSSNLAVSCNESFHLFYYSGGSINHLIRSAFQRLLHALTT